VGSESISVIDPMADIASLVVDAVAAGLDPRLLAFVSVHLRFAERVTWEHAARAAQPAWEVAAYSTDQGHMLRLSRKAHPTARDLAKLRSDALSYAAANSATWLSVSIEDLEQATTEWQVLSVRAEVRLPEQRMPAAIETDNQVQRIERGGTA
jgi:hypothetical protein